MKQKVLIAVGEKSYSSILKETFEKHPEEFVLSPQEVLHRRFLEEILDIEKPDFLIIHDYYLESDFSDQEQRDLELAKLFRTARVNYDDSLRIVFLCERPKGDPFLSTLVSMGIQDIFNKNSFDLDEFIEQLIDKPRFSRVEKFLLTSAPLVQVQPGDNEDEQEGADSETESKTNIHQGSKEEEAKPKQKERPIKVVEKKVIQKTINKNVIKREYKIQFHNQTKLVVGTSINRKLILVGSPFQRTGSTFFSLLLSKYLAEHGIPTSYIENPYQTGYCYDRFFGHKNAKNYSSLFEMFSKNSGDLKGFLFKSTATETAENTTVWTQEGVRLVTLHPGLEKPFTEEEVNLEVFIKILLSLQDTPYTVIDVGADWDKEIYQELYQLADTVYLTIEPDIPNIERLQMSKEAKMKFLRSALEGEKTVLIGNRFTKSIQNQVFDNRLKLFPSFSSETIFKAQYEGTFLANNREMMQQYNKAFKDIAEDLIPKELKKSGKSLFNIFDKRLKIEQEEYKGEKV